MKYIQNLDINPSTIKVGDSITFTFSDGSKHFGRIARQVNRGGYYVEMISGLNHIVFLELGYLQMTSFAT